jgi:hypothetical protein
VWELDKPLSSAPLVFNLFAPMAQELNACPGFVAVEVKLTEAMTEPVPDMLRPRYAELAEACELFIDHAAEALRRNPLQQLLESTY